VHGPFRQDNGDDWGNGLFTVSRELTLTWSPVPNGRLRECHHQSSINNDFQQLVVLKVARALIKAFVHCSGASDGDLYT
jgi:hypothetical protein